MKIAAVTIITWMLVPCVIVAGESRAERQSPQPRLRLDPNSHVAIAATKASPPLAAESPAVVMSPYIVRAPAEARQASRQLPIPQGAPALSGAAFVDALQTGIMLGRTGKKFTAEVVVRGEADAGGFARITIGPNISW